MPRLWFNRAYATTWHTLNQVRAQVPDSWILGSHTDPDSPVLAGCDEVLVEPPTGGEEYVDWALEVAARHRIDLLVPREHLGPLAAARTRFESAGTRVMCPSAQTVELFDDKAAAYRLAADLGLPVPPYHVVSDADGLRVAYADCAARAEQVCMKPVRGVGGQGFRRLTTSPLRWRDDLAGEVRSLVRLDAVCGALDRDGPRELLVMPYLDGMEVSVDVLADTGGIVLAAVGRQHHEQSRRRVIVDNGPAREIAETLVRTSEVAYLSNTQVRWWQDRPYLLELNTRAAGGLFQTALAGVNLPAAAVRLALGEPVGPLVPNFGAEYTDVASFVQLRPSR